MAAFGVITEVGRGKEWGEGLDALEKAVKKMSATEKVRIIFELLLRDNMYGIEYEKTLKSL
jgi:hypothetical protein